jgi:hypothetical protein
MLADGTITARIRSVVELFQRQPRYQSRQYLRGRLLTAQRHPRRLQALLLADRLRPQHSTRRQLGDARRNTLAFCIAFA